MTGPRDQAHVQSASPTREQAPEQALAGRTAQDPWSAGERNEQAVSPATLELRGADAAAVDHARAYVRARAREERAQQETSATEAVNQKSVQASPIAVAAPEVRWRELRPAPPRRDPAIGNVRLGQMVVWQVALIAAVASLRLSLGWLAPIMVVCALAVALTSIRWDGKWAYEWVGLKLRYWARQRRFLVGDDLMGGLGAVTRGPQVHPIEIDEREVGVLAHAGGFTALLRVTRPASASRVATVVDLPSLDALLPAVDSTDPAVSVQALVHTVPAPGLRMSDEAVATSYRELSGGTVPAQRRTWVALQAMHTADARTVADMRIALVNSLRRVERKLTKAGLAVEMVVPGELAPEILAVVQAQRDDTVVEDWDGWYCGGLRQVAFRIANWPDLSQPNGAALVQSLATVPSASSTVAISVRRDGPSDQVEAVVRFTIPSEEWLAVAVQALREIERSTDVEFERLDGKHAFGVAASVPLGGFQA